MVSQLHWLHEATPEKQHLLCLLSLMLAHQSRVAPTYRAAAYNGDITKKMALRHGPPMHKRQPVQNKGYALRLQPTQRRCSQPRPIRYYELKKQICQLITLNTTLRNQRTYRYSTKQPLV